MRRVLAVLALAACGPTSVKLTLTGTPAATVQLGVFEPKHALRLLSDPLVHLPSLPATLVIDNLPPTVEEVRFALYDATTGALGGVRVTLQPHAQASGAVTLSPATPDGDGDHVADPVDDCPTVADPTQDCAGGGVVNLRLVAVQPEVAVAHQLVALEGQFAAGAEVQFPGAAARVAPLTAATADTQHLVVAVPADAGVGMLQVIAPSGRSNGVYFRRSLVDLVPQPSSRSDAQTTTARQPGIPPSYYSASAAIHAGATERVCFSGDAYSSPSVSCALVDADDTLGPFLPTASTVEPHPNGRAVVAGGRLFIVGGAYRFDFTRFTDSVESAPLGADGRPGAFATVGHLTSPRADPALVIIGSYLYVIGGDNDPHGPTGSVATVERASLAADGTLGPFTLVATKLGHARSQFQALVTGSTLHVLGGQFMHPIASGATDPSSDNVEIIEAADIDAEGNLGPFRDEVMWPGLHILFTAVQLDDWIYTIGNNIFVGQYEIFRTQLSAASQIVLSPTPVADLVPDDVISVGQALVLGHTLVIAGTGQNNGVYGSTLRYPLGSTGKLGAFSVAGAGLPAHGSGAAAVVLGANLYLVGGGAAVLMAPIALDGTPGGFVAQPQLALSGARSGLTLAVTGPTTPGDTATCCGYLWAVGGSDGAGALKSIAQASLDPGTGQPLPWMVATPTLVTARAGHVSVIAGKLDQQYLYVIGGADGSVERARILADGGLGAFALVPNVSLKTPRRRAAAYLFRDQLFVLGGVDGNGAALTSIERATLRDDGTVGDFTVVGASTLSSGRDGAVAFVLGPSVHLVGGAPSAADDVGAWSWNQTANSYSLAPFSPTSSSALGSPGVGLGGNFYLLGDAELRAPYGP